MVYHLLVQYLNIVKMGRRSINTTKSGKYMNPTDQARKFIKIGLIYLIPFRYNVNRSFYLLSKQW